MKYMTFNNSCSYAGLANMLGDFGIDIEDYQLAIEMKVPYIFKYDKSWDRYISGSMLQEAKYFNYYLHKLGLNLVETKLDREDAIKFLNNLDSRAMLGLDIKGGHAVIYCGRENGDYIFLNNRRKDSKEPKYYRYRLDDLRERMKEKVIIGYLERGISGPVIDMDKEVKYSLEYLDEYRNEVEEFCSKEEGVDSLKSAMDRLFRALFLDVHSMMEIADEPDLANSIAKVRRDYLQAMQLNKPLTLSEYISLRQINNVIVDYKKLIESQIKGETI